MKRTFSVVGATAIVVLGMAVSSPVQARDDGAIIGGVIGGLALGAIVGGAAAQQREYREPHYGYQPVYVAPRRQMCVERREVWSNRHQHYVVRDVRVRC